MKSFFRVNILCLILFTFGCTTFRQIRYDRDSLPVEWIDEDGDCQKTRAEILIQKSEIKPKFKSKKKCEVVSGKWYDAYSDQYFYKAKEIHIDHVVPLKYAWDHGALNWSKEKWKQFANDPKNLLPVSAKLNMKKGARDPSQWRPPNESFHCEYLKKWTVVKKKYGLKELKRGPASVSEMMKNACKK